MHKTVRSAIQFRRGLSLVEVVVASTLLVVGLAPLFRALTLAQATTRRVETMSQSLVRAQAFLGRVRSQAEDTYSRSLAVTSEDLGDDYLATVTDDRHVALRTVSVAVGLDENRNGELSEGEIQVTLTSSIARRD